MKPNAEQRVHAGSDAAHSPRSQDAASLRAHREREAHAPHDNASRPAVAWLFDVDGVLTSPEHKVILQDGILPELIRRLHAGQPIGLNTGRSLQTVVQRVLMPLEHALADSSLLSSVIVVGEKGATWLTYDQHGMREEHIDPAFGVPSALRESVRGLVEQPEFSTTMFYDDTKRTMISVELRDGHSLADFVRAQERLVARLRTLLAEHALDGQITVDPSTIATDLEHTSVGKGLGAARFLSLLDQMGIYPERYVCLGDSPSDYAMFEEMLRRGKRVEFVFVGGRERLPVADTRAITFTSALYDAGTLEYLTRS